MSGVTNISVSLRISCYFHMSVSPAAYGKEVPAIIEQPLDEIHIHIGKNTVTYEARLLKALFYEVIGWNK